MKIAQINVTYGNADSSGRNVKELHEYLLDKGYESCVFASTINDSRTPDRFVYLYSSNTDKRIHAFLSRLTGKQGNFSYISTKKLISNIAKEDPDAILLHVLHANCINLPLLFEYLKQTQKIVIIVLHDCWYYTGHCCHYYEYKCEKWMEACGNCPQIHKWNKSWFFDFSTNNLNNKKNWYSSINTLAVVGVSDWITNEAKKSILRESKHIRRIYNWINTDVFKPQETDALRKKLCIAKDRIVLLGVASYWSEKKGIKEMALAAEAMPDAVVVMVGILPQTFKPLSNMICVGKISDQATLAQYYSMADAFLNPSIQETFGKTTAEALSCGTPVIAYNTTACSELISSSRGKLVKLNDIDGYIKAIEEVTTSPYGYENSCRNYAVKSFNREAALKQYLDLIQDLTTDN